ncbi:MAG: zinc ribbon domain-containing protein [Thermoplasmataceae archaeon]
MQSFTNNYQDLSNEQGFQFVFKCDVCGDGYKSTFIGSRTAKKKKLFNTISTFGGFLNEGAYMAGALGGQAYQTPAWQKEREESFLQAQNEAMSHFHRCPRCHKYACDLDWNEEAGGLCTNDAPKVTSEIGAAKAQVTKDQIWQNAQGQKLYTGGLETQQTVCPSCGKTSGAGKFCNNCGAALGMKKCQKCGSENSPTTSFCGNCGTKME